MKTRQPNHMINLKDQNCHDLHSVTNLSKVCAKVAGKKLVSFKVLHMKENFIQKKLEKKSFSRIVIFLKKIPKRWQIFFKMM
jgi:hypothetical protein